MAGFSDRVQVLMDEVYDELRKEENQRKGKWDVLEGFSEAHKIAVVFGNFNYQVENGGIEQWIYNGYFHEDAEKFTEYLETGAGSDDRCQVILDRVNLLDQYARDTDCNSDGNYSDEDGEIRSISDLMDCNKFDTWYYEHCDGEGWWETVCGIIDKAEAREAAAAVSQADPAPEEAPAITSDSEDAKLPPFRVYIENASNPGIGGFTIPLPTTKEALAPWLAAIEANPNDLSSISVQDIKSDVIPLRTALGVELAVYTPFDELNYLAARIDGLTNAETDIFIAALETGWYEKSAGELINLTENLDCFDLQPAFSEEHYGEFLLETAKDNTGIAFTRLEQSADEDDKALAAHILKLEEFTDRKAYGRYEADREGGTFTEQGYLTRHGGLGEYYFGQEDIPKVYRIFSQEESPPAVANEAPQPDGAYKRQGGFAEKESVLDKIREAKAAARNAPAQEKEHNDRKKSYEPEV